jgi:hypothetical protein
VNAVGFLDVFGSVGRGKENLREGQRGCETVGVRR